MPQDQDDIKGADAMKQAPTPGPLSGEADTLRTLLDNLVIAQSLSREIREHATDQARSYLYEIRTPHSRSNLKPWGGGPNPVPGQMVEVQHRNGNVHQAVSGEEHAYDWTHDGDETDIIAFRLAPTAPVETSGSERFQDRCGAWLDVCFGPESRLNVEHRNARFLEEAVELVQASGMTETAATDVVRYAFGRPQGEINQEVGGVMMTLAAHCLATGVDMMAEGERELARVWTKVDQIRAKEAAKPSFDHRPLASGGQHSSGEGLHTMTLSLTDVEMTALEALMASKDLSAPAVFRNSFRLYQAADAGLATVTWPKDEAPVAGTAGEALNEAVSIIDDAVNEGLDCFEQKKPFKGRAFVERILALYAAPVPAQDDDKLRYVARLTRYSPLSTGNNKAMMQEDEAGLYVLRKQALAALKSTTAQEGGEG